MKESQNREKERNRKKKGKIDFHYGDKANEELNPANLKVINAGVHGRLPSHPLLTNLINPGFWVLSTIYNKKRETTFCTWYLDPLNNISVHRAFKLDVH